MMKFSTSVLLLLLAFCLTGCPGSSSPLKQRETLLRQTFQAMKQNDWQNYSKLTITTADYDLKQSSVSPAKAKQSYAGGVAKPRMQEQQKADFQEAVTGGEGIIDFRNAQFVSIGSALDQGTISSLNGVQIPYTTYSLMLKIAGQEIDSKALKPVFTVVEWQDEHRLLNLQFNQQ